MKPIYGTSKPQTDFKPIPAGVYIARCYSFVDEGTHTDVFPNAKFAAKPTRSIRLQFEILTDDGDELVRMENGKPFTLGKSYTNSLDKKANLRKLIDGWRSTPLTDEEAAHFEITQLADKYCMMQVTNETKPDGTVRASIGNILNTKKRPESVNEAYSFSVDDPEQEDFDRLPQWLQERVNDCAEFKAKGFSLRVTTKEERAEMNGGPAMEKQAEQAELDEPPFLSKEEQAKKDLDNGKF